MEKCPQVPLIELNSDPAWHDSSVCLELIFDMLPIIGNILFTQLHLTKKSLFIIMLPSLITVQWCEITLLTFQSNRSKQIILTSISTSNQSCSGWMDSGAAECVECASPSSRLISENMSLLPWQVSQTVRRLLCHCLHDHMCPYICNAMCSCVTTPYTDNHTCVWVCLPYDTHSHLESNDTQRRHKQQWVQHW